MGTGVFSVTRPGAPSPEGEHMSKLFSALVTAAALAIGAAAPAGRDHVPGRGAGDRGRELRRESRRRRRGQRLGLPAVGRAPDPVVLVHATGVNLGANWAALSPMLANEGYCVFAFNYGMTWLSAGRIGGLGDIRDLGRHHARLRRAGAEHDRRRQGRRGRPLAGRDDAALLHREPGRRGQGRHVRRPRALQPRDDPERHRHARGAPEPARLRQRPAVGHRDPRPGRSR